MSYDALTKAFGMIAPEEMLRAIPMTMPMTHLVTIHGKRMDGVAKYPLNEWISAGNPCFTTEKWAMMCMLLAELGPQVEGISAQDLEVFDKLFTVATSLKGGPP